VKVATAIIGMPPGIEVIIGTSGIKHVQRTELPRIGAVDLIVVVFIRTMECYLAVSNNEHAVDVAVLPRGNIGIKFGEHPGVESDSLRRRSLPRFCRPRSLRSSGCSERCLDQ